MATDANLKHTKNASSGGIQMQTLEMHQYGNSGQSIPSPGSYIVSPKSYSEEIIRKLSIALRYLLHEDSPLNDINNYNFGKRCRDFNYTLDVVGKNVNKIKNLVDSLWIDIDRDIDELNEIDRFWDLWKDYDSAHDDDDDDSDDSDDGEFKINTMSPQASTIHSKFAKIEEDNMKMDYLDFINKYRKYTTKYQRIDNINDDNKSNEERKNVEESETKPQRLTSSQLADPDDIAKIRDLNKIYSRKAMQNWLKTYKGSNLNQYEKCSKFFKPYHWKKDLNYKLPMNEWNWLQVVSFIEDNEDLKHFSSIFYEYQIDGQELCAMKFKTFEYLIEYALISNHNVFETDFDRFKRMRKDLNNDWQLSQEIAHLLKYIHRGRIQSHIVSRYYLCWEILKHKKDKNKSAGTIHDILSMLKPHYSAGPKQFWKMNAYFYSKIDNYLAVLIANKYIKKIYRKHFPKFLLDQEDDEDDGFPDPNNPRLSQKRTTQTQLRVVQTGPRNWRLKSVDPTTKQSTLLPQETTVDLYDGGGGIGTNYNFTDNFQTHPQKLSVDDMFRSSRFMDLNPVKKKKRYDCFDLIADKCCKKESKMNQYTHAIPRVYIKALAMLIFASVFGCLFVTMWYYNAAIIATDDAMKLTIESIGEREVNFVNYQLFAPQSLQSVGFGEIKIQSDILDFLGINDSISRDNYITDGNLDYLLAEWSYTANTKHIVSFSLYNNNTNTFISGYKSIDDSLIISVYNGTCRMEWKYNETLRRRDLNEPLLDRTDCNFIPRERPWYTELVEVGGVNKSVWTKPYWFQENIFGVTLSTMIQHNGNVYIFLNEMSVNSVLSFYDNDRLLLPKETVIMLVTPSLSVLLSSVGEIDLYEMDDCHNTECKANNEMIVKSMQFVRNNIEYIDNATIGSNKVYIEKYYEELWMNIFPFDALFMDSLLFDGESQHGYIVIVYNETHWSLIEVAYLISWIISAFMLFIGIVLIVYNIKFHRQAYFKRQASKSMEESHGEILGPDGTSRPLKGGNFNNTDNEEEPEENKENNGNELDIQTTNLSTPDDDDDDDDDDDNGVTPKATSVEMDDGKEEEMEENDDVEIVLDTEQEQDAEEQKDITSDIEEIQRDEPQKNKQRSIQLSVPSNDTDNTAEIIPLKKNENDRIKSVPSPESSKMESSRTNTNTTSDSSKKNKLIFEPRCCQLTQQYLIIALFIFMCITFLSITALWTFSARSSIDALIDDVMAPQEWNSVRDKVFQLIESAESVKQTMINRLNHDSIDAIFDEPEFDRIFTNIMSSFVNKNNLYDQYFVYVGKPDGTFRGARVLNPNDTELLISVRDNNNNYTRTTYYTDNHNVVRDYDKGTYSTRRLYDPRCRPWYKNAISKRFSGSLQDAFPDDTWDKFSVDDLSSLSRQTQACKDAVDEYTEIFSNNNETYSNSSQYMVWSTYVFTSLNGVGLTASIPVKQIGTNKLLGVIGIDYTLSSLSKILNESVGKEHNDENWHSWIFEADGQDPFIIASSDDNILTSTNSIDGCLQFESEEEKIQYIVTQHPELYIRIISEEVINFYGVDSNVFKINSTTPFELEAPIDYPISMGGKITYYPDDSGLNWMIMKLVDVSNITQIEGDAFKTVVTVIILVLVLSAICFKEITIQFANGYNEEELENTADDEEEEDDEPDYLADMFKMKVLIEGSTNKIWANLCKLDGDDLMTTEKAKDFLADRANELITAENDRNQIFISCVLQYIQESGTPKWLNKFMTFMFSNYYAIPAQIIIFLHICITFAEPANPTILKMHGLHKYLIIANAVFICLEFIFCVLLNTMHRYYIFTIKREHLIKIYELYYGMKHNWTKKIKNEGRSPISLVIMGPHCSRYILRVVIWLIIVFDFLQRIISRQGILVWFTYRCPLLPFLFIVENRHIWRFFWEFVAAIRFASDVILSYFGFIIMFAIIAMSLFGSTEINNDNELSVDSFDSITRSFITAFVYISTSENYDAVVAETFFNNDQDINVPTPIIINALAICLIFVVIGLFSFIPMIIHRFEESFNKTRILRNELNKTRKSGSLIAAFILLDMNGDLEIDRNEFQQLVTHSILVNKNKLFDIFNTDKTDDIIDINEFVSNLSKQEFRSKMFYHGEQSQNKLQAYLECNIFRRYRNRLITFIIFVLPVFGVGLLRSLKYIDDYYVDLLLQIFFILNLIDILLRWIAFGYRRFFDLARFPNPPYTTAAINKYNSKRKIPIINEMDEDSSKIIRLSASDRRWVVNNLRDTRPQSILEKSVLSICHKLEAICIIFATIIYSISYILNLNNLFLSGYQRHILELGIFVRFFTLLRPNQKLLYVVFTVFPQFASLVVFLILFIYEWARFGCTIFGEGTREIITNDVYPESSNITTRNFKTLSFSMLTLIQLMIGEGWHEIMYYNVMSTSLIFSVYFILYIFSVTIIIANVFVGLFLSDIDELKTKQDDDDTLSQFVKRNSKFKDYANKKLQELHYELQQIDDSRNNKIKQINTFKHLLRENEIANKSVLDTNIIGLINRDRNDTFHLFD